MASPTVAVPPVVGPVFTVVELLDRGFFPRSRVGSCIRAYTFGVIVLVVDEDAVLVRWDDDTTEWTSWLHIAPLGYTVARS